MPRASSSVSVPAMTTTTTTRIAATTRVRPHGRPRRLLGRCRAAADDDATTPAPTPTPTPTKHHWSRKLSLARDDDAHDAHDATLRYNTRIATGAVASVPIAAVHRDGDNATLTRELDVMATFVAAELELAGDDDDDGHGDRGGVARAKKRIEHVLVLLPSLATAGRLKTTGVKTLAALTRDVAATTRRLRALRSAFPSCDVAELVIKAPFVLYEPIDVIEHNLAELRKLFPDAGRDGKPDVDRMVQATPLLLDARFASAALDALCVSAGYASRAAAADAVHRTPSLVLSVESASLRSAYSVNFDQTHVKRNKVIDAGGAGDAYYDAHGVATPTSRAATDVESAASSPPRRRDPELPYW